MKKLLLIPIVIALSACGTEVVYVTATEPPAKEEQTTSAPKTTAPEPFRPPSSNYQEVPNDYDPEGYDTFLWSSVNEFWWLFTKSELLQMGLMVCEAFDSGATLDDVTAELLRVMSNTNTVHMADGLAAVTAGALTFLCPEHRWWLETI